jgi:murein L,D-transpeptidase YafK
MRLAAVIVLVLAGATASSGARSERPTTNAGVHIVVNKGARTLSLYDGPKQLVKTYRVGLGSQPTGPKQLEGDGATPEGEYYVTHANPQSKFHLSVGLSYPNAADAARGVSRGSITKTEGQSIVDAIDRRERPPQHTKLGGDIFVHGGGSSKDWTAGCIALEDSDIEELFARVPIGARVTVLP